jgi:beta-glucosidase
VTEQDPVAEPYRDPGRPLAERVEDLLSRMSLDEKLAQLACVWSTRLVEDDAFSERRARELLAHGTGHVTRIGGSTGLRPAETAAFANAIQRFLLHETRLGIPAIVHEESCAGYTARDADQFPQAIGLASTWDPALVERVGATIREQMLAVGARQTLAPVLDVARDPRWGRVEETYGEDPYLVARIGVAYVRGVQGNDLARGVAATGKHFLGYGLSEGGRNHGPVHLGPRELREVFARPFEAAVREAGLASVMNAYNAIDGLPCGGSKAILDDLLRGELGFDGIVVSDYFTVALLQVFHQVAADKGSAGAMALEAGLDAELPAADCYGAPLRERVESGAVPIERIDRSVRRMLRLKFQLGLFERATVDEPAAARAFQTPRTRALAREVAAKSLVLLRNEGDLLPLDPGIPRLAVIGPGSDDVRLLQGDYHYPAHLEIIYRREEYREAGSALSDVMPRPGEQLPAFRPGPYYPPTATLLDGIREAVSEHTQILVARGCDASGGSREGIAEAVDAARRADVAIVAVGGKSGLLRDCTSGEMRDAADLGLPGAQQELVEAVVATGTPTVVVLVNGRVFALPWIAEHVPALLEAWLPGEEGGAAVADALFGRVSPCGRLPVTLPRAVGQVPVHYDHRSGGGRSQMYGDYSDLPAAPLFPFGHGLSYTRFEYGELRIEPTRVAPHQKVNIEIDVTNAGERAADEVVQLYLRDVVASVTRPVKQLAGFARIPFSPGETRSVRFVLDPGQLAFFDRSMRFVVEPGEVRVMVGASSEDVRAEASFAIDGELRRLGTAEVAPTEVVVE